MSQAQTPQSPCIQVCVLDAHGYCQGCYRTIEEIAGWSRMSAAEQRAVLDCLAARRDRSAPAAGMVIFGDGHERD
jgi:predicted Fe-S protein YdhL (DUF1289 family)